MKTPFVNFSILVHYLVHLFTGGASHCESRLRYALRHIILKFYNRGLDFFKKQYFHLFYACALLHFIPYFRHILQSRRTLIQTLKKLDVRFACHQVPFRYTIYTIIIIVAEIILRVKGGIEKEWIF